MRARIVLGGVAMALCGSVLAAQQQFQILATVLDASGAPAADLQPADVRVLEDDKEGKVSRVEAVERRPSVQILLDNGIGLGSENLTHLRNGVRALIEAIPEGVEMTMVTTAPQPRFVVRATTDRKALLDGVSRLAPDSGAGRFVESLNEATQRIAKEKPDTAPFVITVGSTSGDTNIMERDVERLMMRLQDRPTTVHVVLLVGGAGRSASGGGNQTEIGLAVTKMTGGRYEGINAGTRLATLLPELGALVAKSAAEQKRQFRLTVERPAGSSGDLGRVSMGARTGLQVVGLAMERSAK
jgi:hypothetical protein